MQEAVGLARRNRLVSAFEAVERLPTFVGSRDALVEAVRRDGHPSPAAIGAAIESDPALCAAVLRRANRRCDEPVATVMSALDHVEPAELLEIAAAAETFDVFEAAPGLWGRRPEAFRLHAVAVQRTAFLIARETHHPAPDRLMVSALLHDIGKLVLVAGYAGAREAPAATGDVPEERLQAEMRSIGLTHTMVGGVLARRWGLPGPIEHVITAHHDDDCGPDAATVRLADLLVHHAHGDPVARGAVRAAAVAAGVSRHALRRLAGNPAAGDGPRRTDASPLSRRELQALRGLAHGKVYKEIAHELGLSVSTVRSHLSRTYDKLGARDRAQAVLIASERGWI